MTSIFCSKGHESPGGHRFCQSCGEKLTPVVGGLLMPGTVLEGRYRIVQQIGQGGFGRTYLCENLNRFNEPCVLKEFAPQVQGSYALEKAKKLFEREANVLHKLAHPQIPRFRELFQLNSGGGGLFLVQDYVAGQTYRYLLAERITQNKLFSADEIRQLLLNLLPVLEYIHSVGVIHRDIAPDNLILRSNDNLPVLIDFGGVKQVAVNAEIQVTGGTDLPTCLGKVGYAPHEQLQRGVVYPHSDVYALAATALVLLTGQEPMDMIEPLTLTWNWRQFVTLDPALGAVFDKMLQPNPTARYQTASEALTALQQKQSVLRRGFAKATSNGSSQLNTVVLNPKGGNGSGNHQATAAVAANEGGEFWPILRRSWLGILGVTAIIGGGWGLSKMFSSNSPSTLTPSPSVLATSPSSLETATPNSASPTPETLATSRSTTEPETRSSESPTSRRQERQTGEQTNRQERRTNRSSEGSRRSPSSSAEPRARNGSPRATPSASERATPERSATPSRSPEIDTPVPSTSRLPSPTNPSPVDTNNQPATNLPELVPSQTPEASVRSSRSSRDNSDGGTGGTRSVRRSTSPVPERSTAPKAESLAPRQSTQPSAEPLF